MGDDVENKKDPIILIWAKERQNYVTPMKIVAFQIKSPSKFGWKTSPYAGLEEGTGGELCSIPISILKKYRPTTLEIADVGCPPVGELLTKLDGEDNFFNRLRYLRVYESNIGADQLKSIIKKSNLLTVVEFYESQFDFGERRLILDELTKLKELKALDFIYHFDNLELNEWIKNLRLKLRLVRFSGPPGVKLSAIKKVHFDMPLIEFVAVQDLDVDIAAEEIANKNWVRDLLNRFCHIFPSMKFCYLDYKIFDTVFIYDDSTIRIFEAIRDFFRKLKLALFAILIYCPDADMKESVAKAAKYLAVDCEIRTEMKEFFCGSIDENNGNRPSSNFALLVLGDQVHARTERLVDTIVNQRMTRPDLRHFSYVMDLDAFLQPNSTIAFGGFDKEMVEKTYKEKSSSMPDYVPDIIMERYVNGDFFRVYE